MGAKTSLDGRQLMMDNVVQNWAQCRFNLVDGVQLGGARGQDEVRGAVFLEPCCAECCTGGRGSTPETLQTIVVQGNYCEQF